MKIVTFRYFGCSLSHFNPTVVRKSLFLSKCESKRGWWYIVGMEIALPCQSTTSKMFENPTNMSHYFFIFIHILMQLFERKIKCLPPRKMRLFDRFCNTASKRKKLQLPSSDHNDFLFRLSKQGDADGRTVTILYQCAMTVKYIFHFLSAP